jgi:hypothetical protein
MLSELNLLAKGKPLNLKLTVKLIPSRPGILIYLSVDVAKIKTQPLLGRLQSLAFNSM